MGWYCRLDGSNWNGDKAGVMAYCFSEALRKTCFEQVKNRSKLELLVTELVSGHIWVYICPCITTY